MLCQTETFWIKTNKTDCSVPIKSSYSVLTDLNHLLKYSLGRATVLKSNGVADLLSKHDVHFVRHPLSHTHSRHSSGLSTGYRPLRTRQAPHHVHTPLWDLDIEAKVAINSDNSI